MKRLGAVLVIVAGLVGCVGEPVEDDVETQAVGDWVGNDGANQPCRFDWECSADEGLLCRPSSEAWYRGDVFVHQCLPPGNQGAWCDEDDDCAENLACVAEAQLTEHHFEHAGICTPLQQ